MAAGQWAGGGGGGVRKQLRYREMSHPLTLHVNTPSSNILTTALFALTPLSLRAIGNRSIRFRERFINYSFARGVSGGVWIKLRSHHTA